MINTVPAHWQTRMACAGNITPLWDYRLDPAEGETNLMRARRLHAGKQYCLTCPVLNDCLTYALTHAGLSGLWGGVLFDDAGAVEPMPKRPRYKPEPEYEYYPSMSTSDPNAASALEQPRDAVRHTAAGNTTRSIWSSAGDFDSGRESPT